MPDRNESGSLTCSYVSLWRVKQIETNDRIVRMKITFAATTPETDHVLAVLVGEARSLSEGASRVNTLSDGQLARAMDAGRFEGKTGQIVEVMAPVGVQASRLLLVGTGAEAKADRAGFENIGGNLVARLLTSGVKNLVVDVSGVNLDAGANPAAAIAFGALLRSWRYDQYRTKLTEQQKPSLETITIVGASAETATIFDRMKAVAEGVFFTRELVTEPANIIYPESFVERCRHLESLGVEITVLDEDEMRALGMGALLGVSQGSARAPRLLAMRWDGTDGKVEKPVALVGKGVTFDTGGISIKPAAGMEEMKWDMGGAGAVAGAMKALALRKARAHVIGVCGLVENMPSSTAQRPGDVVTTMSGQTVEVINTDAEGRLVLCDAMTWVQKKYSPEIVVDLATLTGAMLISLGHEYAGLFSNDDTLAEGLEKAGKATGDLLWRFPIGDVYDKMINSDIADMKNVGARYGGSITAAQFLKRFVEDGVKWAHLDIAGTVWAAKPSALWEKGATGYGVRLLDQFIAANYELD